MKLLDLFCGAGGAAVGYHRAGFDEIVGVDNRPMPRYPFTFVLGDALEYVREHGHEFNAIHASPPCQAYTNASNRWRGRNSRADHHVDLVSSTRDILRLAGRVWVIENVVGAPLFRSLLLHGGMFGLGVHRPRVFESSEVLFEMVSPRVVGSIGVYGKKPDGRRLNNFTSQRAAVSVKDGGDAMGIDWMTWDELREAIPPAYTEFIGRQLLDHIRAMNVQPDAG